ncbi:hypothetical protein LCGC14_1092040 [marine sediment metagenome]|uniref:Uncharacterized protein n=1 Tax=marine sediment metagenome TaxID=412755 RepID=A0A0F9MC51_9ZZZZ
MSDTPQQLMDRIDIGSVVAKIQSLPEVLREAMDEADLARQALRFAEDDLRGAEAHIESEAHEAWKDLKADQKKVEIKNTILKNFGVIAARKKLRLSELTYNQTESKVSRIKRNMLSLQCLCGLSEALCNLQASTNQTTIIINKP